jgi:hypothetical protein
LFPSLLFSHPQRGENTPPRRWGEFARDCLNRRPSTWSKFRKDGSGGRAKAELICDCRRIGFFAHISLVLKLGVWLSYVPREGRQIEARRSLPKKVHMSKIQVYRSLIAAAVIGAVWYFAVLSQAAELHPIGRILARGLNAIADSKRVGCAPRGGCLNPDKQFVLKHPPPKPFG